MITITHQGAFPFFFLHYHHEQVIPGEHDTILKWPFRHTVSFTLLDQVNSPHCLIVSQNLHHHCHHHCHRHCHHHCHRHCHHHCHHPQELHHQNGERSKAVNVLESFLPDPTWENFSRPPSVQDRKKEQLGFGFPKYSIQSIFFSPIFFDLKVDLFFQSECIIYQINLRWRSSRNEFAGLWPTRCCRAGTTSRRTPSSWKSKPIQRKESAFELQ